MGFGKKLGQLLKERKLSQTKFGEDIGVNNVSINQYVKETRTPPTEILQKIIDYFPEVDLNWWLRDSPVANSVSEEAVTYKKPLTPESLIENIELNLKELKAQMSQK